MDEEATPPTCPLCARYVIAMRLTKSNRLKLIPCDHAFVVPGLHVVATDPKDKQQ